MSAVNLCDTVVIDEESEFGLQIALGLWGLQFCVNFFGVGGEQISAEGSHHEALAWPREHKGQIGQRTSQDIEAIHYMLPTYSLYTVKQSLLIAKVSQAKGMKH